MTGGRKQTPKSGLEILKFKLVQNYNFLIVINTKLFISIMKKVSC